MNGKFLLDTNAVIALWSNDRSLQAILSTADLVSLPCIVVGELYFGARKSARAEANPARIEEFVGRMAIERCDAITAKHFGRIKDSLRQRGRPIPDNDVWIAALTEQYGLTLLTRDDHFKEIGGLPVRSW